ncbi:hypothetical protein BDV95DRAFT_600158 [Massariosphaeria phaeospora]|uniref:Uncharacterized protein n=1 Tax=Massariosphaeria phaeospora TaxID=100035 RepID=A0A7C8HYE6_9PLEO|nr:hypothetical protein BDV95DRAFT_600158 [Massariosphaeria phaeospora]
MSSIGELQMQIAAVLAEVKSNQHKVQDVIPQEMLDHFQELNELKNAREYIKQAEEREAKLQEQNSELEKELKVAKQAVEDLPGDHMQLKTEYGLMENQADFYKNLATAAEERATKYQQQWQDAQKKQVAADNKQKTIQSLEKELEQEKSIILKLLEENRTIAATYDSMREQDFEKLAAKEEKLMELEHSIADMQEQYQNLEVESDVIEKQLTDVVVSLDTETKTSADAVNSLSNRIQARERHIQACQRRNAATVSEIVPLRNYYDHCYAIIQIYQRIFQSLLLPKENKPVWLPDTLQAALDSAYRELEAFHFVHAAMDSEGLGDEELAVKEHIEGVFGTAKKMQGALTGIAEDVKMFLGQLSQKPDLLNVMRMKFGMLRRK